MQPMPGVGGVVGPRDGPPGPGCSPGRMPRVGPPRADGPRHPSEELSLTSFTAAGSAALSGPDWLVTRRAEAASRLADTPAPSAAEEIWRYSGIDAFKIDDFAPVVPAPTAAGDAVLAEARAAADRIGPRAALVVTWQGAVVALEPAGATAPGLDIAVAGAGPLAHDEAPPTSDAASADDVFHDAFLADALVLTAAPRAVVTEPVVIVHVVSDTGAEGAAPAVFPDTRVVVGTSGELRVVEVLLSQQSDGGGLVCPSVQAEVGDDAHLWYANLQLLGSGCTHIGVQRSAVGRAGTLESFTVGLGGRYARVRTESRLTGEGGRSTLLAAYLGIGEQVHDFRTLQDHAAARTDSELVFTGAVADRARSVYSGLIRIRRGARRADARQTNNNLVLSEGAHADSVPNLDIDENDVRCSHASTVGPIDEEQRFYLESRGIEPALAERLIVLGFFADLAGRAPIAGIGEWVAHAVAERLQGRLPAEQEEPAEVPRG